MARTADEQDAIDELATELLLRIAGPMLAADISQTTVVRTANELAERFIDGVHERMDKLKSRGTRDD